MSKSLGNFFTVRDVLQDVRDPEVLRVFPAEQPLPRADQLFRGAACPGGRDAARTVSGAQGAPQGLARAPMRAPSAVPERRCAAFTRRWTMISIRRTRMAVMQGVARELEQRQGRRRRRASAAAAAAALLAMGRMLGLLQQDPEGYLKRGARANGGGLERTRKSRSSSAARRPARAAKNFAESDRIRDAADRRRDPAGGQARRPHRMAAAPEAPLINRNVAS